MQMFVYEEKLYIRISYVLLFAGLFGILVLSDNFSSIPHRNHRTFLYIKTWASWRWW